VVTQQLYGLENRLAHIHVATDYAGFRRGLHLEWFKAMCAVVGVLRPPDEESWDLIQDVRTKIIRSIRADLPGAADAIRWLHSAGFTLHTASGEFSGDISGYLEGIGVRNCFRRLYGPDLIDTFKESPEFYVRIFRDAGIEPEDAVVIDDSPLALDWAHQAGSIGVLIRGYKGDDVARTENYIEGLAMVPELLMKGGISDFQLYH
jgi:HAD superfamily hydrolase (TIGR01509 family)